MSIFNSLGSNYTLETVLETFAASDKESNTLLLKKFLEEKYGGDVTLVYKGREALRLALRAIAPSLNTKSKTVGICGFTCFAVYDAIVKEGYKAEYLDIDETLNFSVETLKNAVEKNPNLKVVIVQNTLGYPCDIEKIAEFCKKKKIVLIEDLAHAIGAKYSNGKEAGTIGDFVVLSFSQDKMIDGISGGALVIRNTSFSLSDQRESKGGLRQAQAKLPLEQQKRDRTYPFFTFLIRKTYAFGLGKGLHMVLKRRNMLTQPMENLDSEEIFSLPNWYSQLILSEYHQLEKNLEHRKAIVKIYAEKLNKKMIGDFFVQTSEHAANLRFPVFVPNREGLISNLKQKNIFVSDIWYDAPIGPKKYLSKTDYNGECPISEKVAERILNLPTHKNVSEKDAAMIAEEINIWLKSQ